MSNLTERIKIEEFLISDKCACILYHISNLIVLDYGLLEGIARDLFPLLAGQYYVETGGRLTTCSLGNHLGFLKRMKQLDYRQINEKKGWVLGTSNLLYYKYKEDYEKYDEFIKKRVNEFEDFFQKNKKGNYVYRNNNTLITIFDCSFQGWKYVVNGEFSSETFVEPINAFFKLKELNLILRRKNENERKNRTTENN